jgi:hypothetical protein
LWKKAPWLLRAGVCLARFRFGEAQRIDVSDKIELKMPTYPIKKCVVCGEEFELKPDKPGFANRCPDCTEEEAEAGGKVADPLKGDKGANAARREAMKNLLYRKDS